MYFGARYYDPLLGQFTSADVSDVDGLNRYAYVNNNPLRYTDPTGNNLWDAVRNVGGSIGRGLRSVGRAAWEYRGAIATVGAIGVVWDCVPSLLCQAARACRSFCLRVASVTMAR